MGHQPNPTPTEDAEVTEPCVHRTAPDSRARQACVSARRDRPRMPGRPDVRGAGPSRARRGRRACLGPEPARVAVEGVDPQRVPCDERTCCPCSANRARPGPRDPRTHHRDVRTARGRPRGASRTARASGENRCATAPPRAFQRRRPRRPVGMGVAPMARTSVSPERTSPSSLSSTEPHVSRAATARPWWWRSPSPNRSTTWSAWALNRSTEGCLYLPMKDRVPDRSAAGRSRS